MARTAPGWNFNRWITLFKLTGFSVQKITEYFVHTEIVDIKNIIMITSVMDMGTILAENIRSLANVMDKVSSTYRYTLLVKSKNSQIAAGIV